MKAMKRLAVIFALAAIAVLFTGCEVWLFFADGGGGGASGIGMYADIGVLGTDVAADRELRAVLFKDTGTYDPVKQKAGNKGAEVFRETFTDVDSGYYKVVIYYDSLEPYGSPNWNLETGYTSGRFYYQSGDYRSIVVDEASQWDENNVQQP